MPNIKYVGKNLFIEKLSVSNIAEKGQKNIKKLLELVDKDTESFNKIMEAFRLPESDSSEKKIKDDAILKATIHAIEVPLEIMKTLQRGRKT